MKKLMIAAAVAMLGVAANAAAFNWGFTSDEIEGPSGSYIDGGTAFLYIGDTLIAEGGQNDNYTFGSFDLSTNDETGKVRTLADGDISESFVGQDYKLVLKYTEILADGTNKNWEYTYTGVSNYASVSGEVGELAKNYETFMTDYVVQAGDWKSEPVPEPTSAMLLLLGVAGLALRRKAK